MREAAIKRQSVRADEGGFDKEKDMQAKEAATRRRSARADRWMQRTGTLHRGALAADVWFLGGVASWLVRSAHGARDKRTQDRKGALQKKARFR